MGKTLSINKEIAENTGHSIAEVLSMASLYFGELINRETFTKLCAGGLALHDGYDIFRVPKNPTLTEKGIELIESVFLNSEYGVSTEVHKNRFDILADKLREIYPGGKKPGTAYMWRDSTTVIAKRLKAFFKKYEDTYIAKTGESFNDADIVEATQKYIESFNGDTQYMQLLKYFINKKNPDGEDVSQLLSYIENKDDTDSLNDNWINSVR